MKHTFVHFEIPADDVERARKFYTELFGWQISSPPEFPEYLFVKTGDEDDLAGGMMKRQGPEQGPIYYVQVESVDATCVTIEQLGGRIIVPKSPVPGMGWFAHFVDTEGNVFALWQTDESAA